MSLEPEEGRFKRPGELHDGPPTAGDHAELARNVHKLLDMWQFTIMPALSKQTASIDGLDKRLGDIMREVHKLGATIDAMKKVDADLAISFDASKHLVTERVSRLELQAAKLETAVTMLMGLKVPRPKPRPRKEPERVVAFPARKARRK